MPSLLMTDGVVTFADESVVTPMRMRLIMTNKEHLWVKTRILKRPS
jgi:hypothetical protein